MLYSRCPVPMPSENGFDEGFRKPESRKMMRQAGLNGIVMNNKITLGELLSLGILMVTLAGGGYALHSDIAQVRLELGEKIDAKFDQVDAKVNEMNRRMADLQERVATVETIMRVQTSGMATDK